MLDWPVVGYRVPTLIGGVALLALAAWIFALSPGSRVHRAFALFLTLRGMLSVLLAFDSNVFSEEGRVFGYVFVALPFAALHLANQAWVGRGDATPTSALRSPAVSWALLGVVLVLELLYFADHDLFVRRAADGNAASGPLGYSVDAIYPSYALVGLVLALAHVRSSNPPRRRALFGLSLGFMLPPAYACTFFVMVTVGAWERIDVVDSAMYLLLNGLGALGIVATVTLLVAHARRQEQGEFGDVLRYATLLGLAILSGAVTYVVMLRAQALTFLYVFTFGGLLWTFVLVGLITYAIVANRFLELDLKVRWTISRGVVASALVAVFFVFSEGTSQYLGQEFSRIEGLENAGAFMGILAVGALLFALNPLRRLGEKVGGAAMPEAVPVEKRTLHERLSLYAEQTRIAWEDGALTAKERRLLDHVRRRLGLSDDQAARLERDVLAELMPDRRSVVRTAAAPARRRAKT